MVRTQIQLTEELAASIKLQAARERVSMAELIRRAAAQFLEATRAAPADDPHARALAVAGRFRSGRRSLSARHNDEFAEASRR